MMPAPTAIRPGVVVRVLAAAGVDLPPGAAERAKVVLRCPLHEDTRPSAFVSPGRNIFYCSTCGTFTAKALAEALSVPWPGVLDPGRSFAASYRPAAPRRIEPTPAFGPELAARAWRTCLARVQDPRTYEEDREVYEYLRSRGLVDVLGAEEDLFGIAPPDPRALPRGCEVFYARGTAVYRLVAPLWRPGIALPVSLQARAVRQLEGGAPRIMSPRGSRQAEALFANRLGRKVLAGSGASGPAILGEGLADFLVLATAAPRIPVLSAPGAGGAARSVAAWARGRVVLLALDADEAGEEGARRAARRIRELGGRPVRLRWPDGAKDAADVAKARGLPWLGEELAKIAGAGEERTK